MMLYIIVPQAAKYKKAIEGSCNYVGIKQYQILDPKHDKINERFFSYVLIMDKDYKFNSTHAKKLWRFDYPPLPDLAREDKKKYLNELKKIFDELRLYSDKDIIKKDDLPPIQDLEKYINSQIGSVIEIKLPDKRRIGIYPDTQPLEGLYEIEYHASIVVNLNKLATLFNATEIFIKEV